MDRIVSPLFDTSARSSLWFQNSLSQKYTTGWRSWIGFHSVLFKEIAGRIERKEISLHSKVRFICQKREAVAMEGSRTKRRKVFTYVSIFGLLASNAARMSLTVKGQKDFARTLTLTVLHFASCNLAHIKAAYESGAGAHARKAGAQALALDIYFQYVPSQDLYVQKSFCRMHWRNGNDSDPGTVTTSCNTIRGVLVQFEG